jgi:hypothetical protein
MALFLEFIAASKYSENDPQLTLNLHMILPLGCSIIIIDNDILTTMTCIGYMLN